MEISIDLKQQLHQQAISILDDKIDIIHKAMSETNESMLSDTKSSAGDKYETGRERMQIELNNLKVQLNQLEQSKTDLKKINLSKPNFEIGFGSIVFTDLGIYFISIGLGKVQYLNQSIYLISMASPIGKVLKGHKSGDTITFNKRQFSIKETI